MQEPLITHPLKRQLFSLARFDMQIDATNCKITSVKYIPSVWPLNTPLIVNRNCFLRSHLRSVVNNNSHWARQFVLQLNVQKTIQCCYSLGPVTLAYIFSICIPHIVNKSPSATGVQADITADCASIEMHGMVWHAEPAVCILTHAYYLKSFGVNRSRTR